MPSNHGIQDSRAEHRAIWIEFGSNLLNPVLSIVNF